MRLQKNWFFLLFALVTSLARPAIASLPIVSDEFNAMGPRIITAEDQKKAAVAGGAAVAGQAEDPYAHGAMHQAMQQAALGADPYAPLEVAHEPASKSLVTVTQPEERRGALPTVAEVIVRELQEEVKAKEKALTVGVQQQLSTLQLEIQDRASKMRREADELALKVKQRTEGEVQQLMSAASAQVSKITQQVAQEAVRIKEQAAQRALMAINQVEEEALLQRFRDNQRRLAEQFGVPQQVVAGKLVSSPVRLSIVPSDAGHPTLLTPLVATAARPVPAAATSLLVPQGRVDGFVHGAEGPSAVRAGMEPTQASSGFPERASGDALGRVPLKISAEWKNDISRQFYTDMTLMKGIILEAESPSAAQEFSKQIEEQNLWFDNTLRSTHYVTDEGYKKIQAKQERLSRIMQAQRKADEDLAVLTRGLAIDPLLLKKVRLSTLYDLNSLVVQREHHLDATQRFAALSDEEINQVVKRTLAMSSHQFQELAAQFPGVAFNKDLKTERLSIPSMVQQLQEELGRLRDDFKEASSELSTAKTKLVEAESALKTSAVAVSTAHQELGVAQSQREDLAKRNKEIKVAAAAVIDKGLKEKLDVELSLAGANQTVDAQRKELTRLALINNRLAHINKTLVARSEQLDKLAMDAALDVHAVQEEAAVEADKRRREVGQLREGHEREKMALMAEVRQAQEHVAHAEHERAAAQQQEHDLKRVVEKDLGRSRALAASLEQTQQDLRVTQRDFEQQKGLTHQARARAVLADELAQKTIDSINAYLRDEQENLASTRREAQVRQRELDHKESVLTQEEELLSRQREALMEHQESLVEERRLLQAIKMQTQDMVRQASNMTHEQHLQLQATQDEVAGELRAIRDETQAEIARARGQKEAMSLAEREKMVPVPEGARGVALMVRLDQSSK